MPFGRRFGFRLRTAQPAQCVCKCVAAVNGAFLGRMHAHVAPMSARHGASALLPCMGCACICFADGFPGEVVCCPVGVWACVACLSYIWCLRPCAAPPQHNMVPCRPLQGQRSGRPTARGMARACARAAGVAWRSLRRFAVTAPHLPPGVCLRRGRQGRAPLREVCVSAPSRAEGLRRPSNIFASRLRGVPDFAVAAAAATTAAGGPCLGKRCVVRRVGIRATQLA